MHCSERCRELAREWRRRPEGEGEERFATRSEAFAARLVRAFRARGYRLKGSPRGRGSGYVSRWQRGPVILIKAVS